MSDSRFAKMTFETLLAEIAAKQPVPGGGAVAGITLALGASLGRMVLAYSLGKKRFTASEDSNLADDHALRAATGRFLALADDDARGYERLNALQRLPEDDPRRAAEFAAGVHDATLPALEMLRLGGEIARRLETLPQRTNEQLASDLAIALDLTRCGLRAAALNARANLPLMQDREEAATHEAMIMRVLAETGA